LKKLIKETGNLLVPFLIGAFGVVVGALIASVILDLGIFLMYMFLAVIGASSNILELFTAIPGILAFAAITLLVHLIISLAGAKLFKISLKEVMIASCANAGGPSVSAPMAVSFGMKKAVTPAILIGLLGYVIGTFLGVGVGLFLR